PQAHTEIPAVRLKRDLHGIGLGPRREHGAAPPADHGRAQVVQPVHALARAELLVGAARPVAGAGAALARLARPGDAHLGDRALARARLAIRAAQGHAWLVPARARTPPVGAGHAARTRALAEPPAAARLHAGHAGETRAAALGSVDTGVALARAKRAAGIADLGAKLAAV